MALGLAATCVFFFAAPAGGARAKKSNKSAAFQNLERGAGQVESLPENLASALRAEVGQLFGYAPKKKGPGDGPSDLDVVLTDRDGSDVAKKWAAILKKKFPVSQAKVDEPFKAVPKLAEPLRAAPRLERNPVLSLQELMEKVKAPTENLSNIFPTIPPRVHLALDSDDERPSLRRNPITAEVRALGTINELPSGHDDGLASSKRPKGPTGAQILDQWTEKFKKDFPVSTPHGKTVFDGLIQELEALHADTAKRSKPTVPRAFTEEKGTSTKFRVVDKQTAKKEQVHLSKHGADAEHKADTHIKKNGLAGQGGVDRVSANVAGRMRRNVTPTRVSFVQLLVRHVWTSIILVCGLASVAGLFSLWRTHANQREEAVVKIQALYRGSKYRQNLFGEQNPLDYRLSTVNAGQ